MGTFEDPDKEYEKYGEAAIEQDLTNRRLRREQRKATRILDAKVAFDNDILSYFAEVPSMDDYKLRSFEEIKEEFRERVDKEGYMGYTLTVRPDVADEYQDIEIRQMVFEIIIRYADHYTLIPALQGNGHIHWHGVVKLPRDRMNGLKRKMSRAVGFSRLEFIKNNEHWKEYVCDAKEQRHKSFDNERDLSLLSITDCGRYIV